MDRLLATIKTVCAKPGMYVGPGGMRQVRAFLDGYVLALSESRELSGYPFGGFLLWLEQRHGICHSAWGWDRILVHAAGSEEEAIRTLPATFEQYRTERERGEFVPDDNARVMKRAPEQTCTKGYYDR
jgi:hypothetical protein